MMVMVEVEEKGSGSQRENLGRGIAEGVLSRYLLFFFLLILLVTSVFDSGCDTPRCKYFMIHNFVYLIFYLP